MSFLGGWNSWRQFKKLPWEWRNLVFYSESGQDWHQFSRLIDELNNRWGRKLCYVTSDPGDPGLSRQHDNFLALCIPEGLFLTLFFQVSQADVFVLTMMDLGNLHLQRSLYPVHYVYLFHSMGSTHMVDHANSFDHYETLFCTGPHQVTEIRKREEMHQLPAKHLFAYGHPRLEQVMREGTAHQAAPTAQHDPGPGRPPVILIAPTWGDTSLFNVCGAELITVLLAADFHVIMRPHYQSQRLSPAVIKSLRESFSANPHFEYVDQMGETNSILRSDLLISDWSAMALEYALGLEKPVLFIEVPRRIRNPNWQELGIEPIESSIREQIGTVVSPANLEQVPQVIDDLLARSGEFVARMRKLRKLLVFRLGHSVPDGAAEIVRLADQQSSLRLARGAQHA
ncbi:MAG TPA: CDP-glycerol glycerophosphotransferase family protein [Xanthomonadales bacterium]|nr:CDP-glycerol glycerophosphotransferase family protein [Xanthomonadales bacterium]